MLTFLISLAFATPPGVPPANWPISDYAVPTGLFQLWQFDPVDSLQLDAVCQQCLASLDDTCWTDHSAKSIEQVGSTQFQIDHRFSSLPGEIFQLPDSFDVGTLNGNDFCVYADVANMDTNGLAFYFYYTRTQSGDFGGEECDLTRPLMDGDAHVFHLLTESACAQNYLIQLPDLTQETTPGCTVEYDYNNEAQCGEHVDDRTISMPLAKCLAKAEYQDFVTRGEWEYSSTKIDGDIVNGLILFEWDNVMDCSGGSWTMHGCAVPDGTCQQKYVGNSRMGGELTSRWDQKTVTISDPRNCVSANGGVLNGLDWCNGYECELGELDIQNGCYQCGEVVEQEVTREATGAYTCAARQVVTCSAGQGSCCSEKCDTTQDDAVKAALEASSTTECTSFMSLINAGERYYSENVVCDCFTSDDFSSLSNYDCKLDCDHRKTISAYAGSDADTCTSDDSDSDCDDLCNQAQGDEIATALQASETTECASFVLTIVGATDPTDAQICGCFGSDDFSSLSAFDCKMNCGNTQTVARYASGSGVCDSGTNALSVLFALITLLFALA